MATTYLESYQQSKETKLRWTNLYILVVLLICGCGQECTLVVCTDSLDISLVPESQIIAGNYVAQITFSDDSTIIAELAIEVVDCAPADTDDVCFFNLMPEEHILSGAKYWHSNWGPIGDRITITFTGDVPDGPAELVILRDGLELFNGIIEPEFEYYWCNGKDCDSKKNKQAEMELTIN